MAERTLLAQDALAARLGVDPAWLGRHLARLYRQGLPRPLVLCGQKRWDPRALDLWLDRCLDPPPAAARPPAEAANDAANDPLAATLAARARALAGAADAKRGSAAGAITEGE